MVKAAANLDITDRFSKHHRRWRSENAKDGYVKDSLDERLKVSHGVGLSDAAAANSLLYITFFVITTLLSIIL